MRRLCRRTLAMLALVALSPALAAGQPAKVGIVTTLEGNVTARRAALPRPISLKFKDDVFFHDTINTGERSLARVPLELLKKYSSPKPVRRPAPRAKGMTGEQSTQP